MTLGIVHYESVIQVSVAEFEREAEQLLEQVCATGESVQIFEGGQPVALLNPVEEEAAPKRVFGVFKDEVTILGDIVGPIVDVDERSGTFPDLA